jgi:hypothetical protein
MAVSNTFTWISSGRDRTAGYHKGRSFAVTVPILARNQIFEEFAKKKKTDLALLIITFLYLGFCARSPAAAASRVG